MCEHLEALEAELAGRGIALTYRGRAWSRGCREWAYYACHLDLIALRSRLGLPACVEDHENHDPRSGTERGFVCTRHDDAIMGRLEPSAEAPTVR